MLGEFEDVLREFERAVSNIDDKLTELTSDRTLVNDLFSNINDNISNFTRSIQRALNALSSNTFDKKLDLILSKVENQNTEGLSKSIASEVEKVVDNRLKIITTQIEQLSMKVGRLQEELIMSEGEKEYIKTLLPQDYLSGVTEIGRERAMGKSIGAAVFVPIFATCVLLALASTSSIYSIYATKDENQSYMDKLSESWHKSVKELKIRTATGIALTSAIWDATGGRFFADDEVKEVDENVTIDDVTKLKAELKRYQESVLTKDNLKDTLLDSDFVVELANKVNSKLETVQISEYDMNKIVNKISTEILESNFKLTQNDVDRLRLEISKIIGIEEDGAIMGSFVDAMKEIAIELKSAVTEVKVTNVEVGLGQDVAGELNKVSTSVNQLVDKLDKKTGFDLKLVGNNIPEQIDLAVNQESLQKLAQTKLSLDGASVQGVKLQVDSSDIKMKLDDTSYQQFVDALSNVKLNVDSAGAEVKLNIPQALKLGLNMKDDHGQDLAIKLKTKGEVLTLGLTDVNGKTMSLPLDISKPVTAQMVHSPSVSDIENKKAEAQQLMSEVLDNYLNTKDHRGLNKLLRDIESHDKLFNPSFKKLVTRSDGAEVAMPNGHYPKMEAMFYYDKNMEQHFHQEGKNEYLCNKADKDIDEGLDVGKHSDSINLDDVKMSPYQKYVLSYYNEFSKSLGMEDRVIKYDKSKVDEALRSTFLDSSKIIKK